MSKRNIGQEILQGLKEIKQWQHGKIKLRTTEIKTPTGTDITEIRNRLNLTQQVFAIFMGVSAATLRNWEQGRRSPHGSAKSLLLIAKKAPEAFLKALHVKHETRRGT
jgi:putative transcriptional regulator